MLSSTRSKKKTLNVLTGIDCPMPDVCHYDATTNHYERTWNNHGEWTGFFKNYESDFQLLAGLGFNELRVGVPWSLVQPGINEYDFSLLDSIVSAAFRQGIKLHYVGTHYNQPEWLKGRYDDHQCLSAQLPDAFAKYSSTLIERYGFDRYQPIVEIGTEARFRGGRDGLEALWAPHKTGLQSQVKSNLIKAFIAGAQAARGAGAMIVCSEACDDFDVAMELAPHVDALGMNYYGHHHLGFYDPYKELKMWGQIADAHGSELWVTECGSHENFVPKLFGGKTIRQPYVPGEDTNRLRMAEILEHAFKKACAEGIPLTTVFHYPGTAGMWRTDLTCRPGKPYPNGDKDDNNWCDRGGLVDGITERVVCKNLVEKVLSWREIETASPALQKESPSWFPSALVQTSNAIPA